MGRAQSHARPRSKVILLRILTNAFERRGWRDDGETAMRIVTCFVTRDRRLSERDLASVVPSSFYALNGISRRDLLELSNETLSNPPR